MKIQPGDTVRRDPRAYPERMPDDAWFAQVGVVETITVSLGQKFARVRWGKVPTLIALDRLAPAGKGAGR